MNINLDKKILKSYVYGRRVSDLYSFSIMWYRPARLEQLFEGKKSEINKEVTKVKQNKRVNPIIKLEGYGIVAGYTQLEAFRREKFEKVPVLVGKYKGKGSRPSDDLGEIRREIEKNAEFFHRKDKRISYERALSESILMEVLFDLDEKRKIKNRYLTK